MGTPAQPTPDQRAERRALALRIVAAVENDEPDPLRDLPFLEHDDAVFGLAQEVVMLTEEAVTVTVPGPPVDPG